MTKTKVESAGLTARKPPAPTVGPHIPQHVRQVADTK